MVLLPLLRSLPIASAVSLVAAVACTTGLDAGLLHLGHPDTAADALVASMMAFSVAVPSFWGVYVVTNGVKWLTGAVHDVLNWMRARQTSDAVSPLPTHQSEPAMDAGAPAASSTVSTRAPIGPLQNVPTAAPPE